MMRRSRSPTSLSEEGEIVESDLNLNLNSKANKPQNSVNGSDIDLSTRKNGPARRSRSPRSRSPPLAWSSHHTSSRSPSSRSRSPSCSPRRYPRGDRWRRIREGEHDYDSDRSSRSYSWRSSSRYDDRWYDRNRDRSYRRRKRQYHDLDRGDTYEYNPKRYRTRSRSPYRDPRKPKRYSEDEFENGNDRRTVRENDQLKGDVKRKSHVQSVNELEKSSSLAQESKKEAETGKNKPQQVRFRDPNGDPVAPEFSQEKDVAIPEPIDEAALIEERRKRREAILAKYRKEETSSQPLRHEHEIHSAVADTATETPATADPGSQVPAPTEESQKTVSGPQSPIVELNVAKDEDLANSLVMANDALRNEGVSAADYDPTNDMREDRMKRDGNDVSLDSEHANKALRHGMVVLEPATKQPKQDFDMFADDDDMFAEYPEASTKNESDTKEAQKLDVSLMDNWDDPEGYYNVMLGELIDGRYHVREVLGRGMFSSVIRATDSQTGKIVAIKITRKNDTMRKAGMKEIDILQKLSEADPEDRKHIVRCYRHFDHKGHLCLVFENLSMNLRDLLRKFGRDVGINLRAIRAYAQQMFLGLSLMRKCDMIHADLKPDNLLVNESRSLLKVSDLGSASPFPDVEITQYLVSRFYRAPEIILGIPYDYGIDMWSVGCTLYELYTGKTLFTGRDNNQMLRSIMECRGSFPPKLLRRGALTYAHFDDFLNFMSVENDKITGRAITRTIAYKKPTMDLKTRLMGKGTKGMSDTDVKELTLFIDLLDKCLSLNPDKRCTPTEALKHPFITRNKI